MTGAGVRSYFVLCSDLYYGDFIKLFYLPPELTWCALLRWVLEAVTACMTAVTAVTPHLCALLRLRRGVLEAVDRVGDVSVR